jgi:predicted transcriptional regulator
MTERLDEPAAILISIQPQFALPILDGTKRFELRRQVPRLRVGDRALIYASAPLGHVVGEFSVADVLAGSPEEVWAAIGGASSGLPEGGFFAYLRGAKRCAAIAIGAVRRYDPPLPLPFRAPQSYLFLRADDPAHAELLQMVR